jgi:hypothetical protein
MINSTYNNNMISTVTGPTSTYTVTATDSTISNGAGLYWGMNGTSASPSSGQAGQVLTSNGTNTSWITAADPNLKGASIQVKGDAEFDGEVTVKGKKLSEMFEKIEERLAILHPNPELEDRWDELKELGKRYKELEQEIIEKEKMWAILKK